MAALQKLMDAREKFHASKLTKTGHNKFAGYYYFELSDFLLPAMAIFREVKLGNFVSFDKELATMRIVDLEDGSEVVITSPMSTAALKACHEVQNLGAVETYERRYLWVAALEIVEHDAIDSSEGAEKKEAAPKPTAARKTTAKDPVREIEDGVESGDASGAASYLAGLDQRALDAIWSKLKPAIQDKLTAAWPQ